MLETIVPQLLQMGLYILKPKPEARLSLGSGSSEQAVDTGIEMSHPNYLNLRLKVILSSHDEITENTS